MATARATAAVNHLNSDVPIEHAFDIVGNAEIIPPKFIIKNVVPVGMSVLVSPPKNFKSTILLHWALRAMGKVSTAFPEHLSEAARTGPVVMVSTETTPGVMKFDAMFGLGVHITGSDALYVQSNPFAFRLDNADNMREFYYWMDRINPVMIVWDPFRNSHSQDENDAGAVVQMMQPFQQYCVRRGIAGIIVHHTKKPGEKSKPEDMLRPDAARGTGALFGLADGLISLVVVDQQNFELPQMMIAATLKRGKPIFENVELAIEWPKLKLDSDIAANVYNAVLAQPRKLSELGEVLNMPDAEVLKYLSYMDKKRIVKRGKHQQWEIEE